MDDKTGRFGQKNSGHELHTRISNSKSRCKILQPGGNISVIRARMSGKPKNGLMDRTKDWAANVNPVSEQNSNKMWEIFKCFEGGVNLSE